MHSAALTAPPNRHLALPRGPSLATAALNRASDWLWERRLGIRTAGCREVNFADAARYQPLPYFVIQRVLDRLALRQDDVLVDLGSGKGRVVCAAARHDLREVIGVEIVEELHTVAVENVRRLHGARTPVRLIAGSATDFDFRDVTVVCFFNPFGGETMHRVLDRFESSLRLKPRNVRIAYVNPVCTPDFAARSWLRFEEAWEMSIWSRIKTPVHFYHTEP
jgi:predicted RNA methylase